MADVNENDTGSNAVSKQHYAFQDIYHFICSTRYPENMKDNGEKANFRRAAKAVKGLNPPPHMYTDPPT